MLDGTGECIAIIELGGGFRRKDLTAYFAALGIPAPTVSSVSVDGGRNQPSTADSADGEVMLDIEVAAAIAPKARIAVYFAPNTDRGFLDAITRAVHDTQTEAVGHLDQLGRRRERLDGPGDAGHGPGLRRRGAAGRQRAGGVRRRRVGRSRRRRTRPRRLSGLEPARHSVRRHPDRAVGRRDQPGDGPGTTAPDGGATGGGVSDVFGVPAYQVAAQGAAPRPTPGHHVGRGVPDVAGNASPASGYVVRVDGQTF